MPLSEANNAIAGGFLLLASMPVDASNAIHSIGLICC